MTDSSRRTVAAIVLIVSVLVVVYLVLFTPGETSISTPTPSQSAVTLTGAQDATP